MVFDSRKYVTRRLARAIRGALLDVTPPIPAVQPDRQRSPGEVKGTVLLDAGGVLLDLDYAYLRRLIEAGHREVSVEELARLEAVARMEIHRHVADGGRVSEAWRDYFHIILSRVGVPGEEQSSIADTDRSVVAA